MAELSSGSFNGMSKRVSWVSNEKKKKKTNPVPIPLGTPPFLFQGGIMKPNPVNLDLFYTLQTATKAQK